MRPIFFLLFIAILTGCNTHKKVMYFQEAGKQAVFPDSIQAKIPDPIIKLGDVLMITVNTNTPEAALPFNLPLIPSGDVTKAYSGGSGSNLSSGLSLQNYLVDMEGNILFPVVGKIHVAGMTKKDLSEKIQQAIYPQYLTEKPIVLVRYTSFKVSVLGEVMRPGTFVIDNEKVSILEALALAGDMTIYGRRENILLIRENNGNRETIRIDIRDKNLINSPYFYLQQNDVIYVVPNKSKSRSSAINTAESLLISVVGTLISLTTLVINIVK